MPITDIDIVNQAITLSGDNQAPVTGSAPNFDSSTAGKAAALLYVPTVQAVGRQFGWDFARNTAALVTTGNTARFPWSFEWLYPTNGIQVWQLIPPDADPFDPSPINWNVGNTLVAAVQKKVIWTNFDEPLAVFNNAPSPDVWDVEFTEAVVRLLGSKFALALGGNPSIAAALLESGGAFESIAEGRQD